MAGGTRGTPDRHRPGLRTVPVRAAARRRTGDAPETHRRPPGGRRVSAGVPSYGPPAVAGCRGGCAVLPRWGGAGGRRGGRLSGQIREAGRGPPPCPLPRPGRRPPVRLRRLRQSRVDAVTGVPGPGRASARRPSRWGSGTPRGRRPRPGGPPRRRARPPAEPPVAVRAVSRADRAPLPSHPCDLRIPCPARAVAARVPTLCAGPAPSARGPPCRCPVPGAAPATGVPGRAPRTLGSSAAGVPPVPPSRPRRPDRAALRGDSGGRFRTGEHWPNTWALTT